MVSHIVGAIRQVQSKLYAATPPPTPNVGPHAKKAKNTEAKTGISLHVTTSIGVVILLGSFRSGLFDPRPAKAHKCCGVCVPPQSQ